MTLKVSIIIPTYNRPKFLIRAVNSALSQTYADIEVIVVSDNEVESKEELETLELMQGFLSDDRFTYLGAEGNHGSCAARNRGLAFATGEYVNFLDDDDVLFTNKIEEQVKIIESSKETITVIGCKGRIRASSDRILRIEEPKFDPKNILFSQLKQNICTTSLNLIDTKICREVGGWESIQSSQEHLLLIKLFNRSPKFSYVDIVLAEIDQHAGPRISTNIGKPLGVLELSRIIFERYTDTLTDQQVIELVRVRGTLDVQAYFQMGERKRAWIRFFKIVFRHPLAIDNVRMLKTALYTFKQGV